MGDKDHYWRDFLTSGKRKTNWLVSCLSCSSPPLHPAYQAHEFNKTKCKPFMTMDAGIFMLMTRNYTNHFQKEHEKKNI